MWLANLREAVWQGLNLKGVLCSAMVITTNPNLALPHLTIPDISHIDWSLLKNKGFKGVVFDKDNTITAPYSLKLWPSISPSLEQCKSVFGSHIAVFSNSVGLHHYDPNGHQSEVFERETGIKVLKHKVNKPSSNAKEIEAYFGCRSSLLVMVGDRYFTDVIYGNRNGLFTILTEPLTPSAENFVVRLLRKVEGGMVDIWRGVGVKPSKHGLLSDVNLCITQTPWKLNGVMDHFKMALDCFFAVWFVVGNVWIFGGHTSPSDAPKLYRLCIVFLTFSCIGYAMPFILCATICCCLPCVISLLGFREEFSQNRGATADIINTFPVHKFKLKKNINFVDPESNSGGGEGGGVLAAGTENERPISGEDAVCCICLGKYGDGDELRELSCLHFFHVECVDKWLKISAICPLCKSHVGHPPS